MISDVNCPNVVVVLSSFNGLDHLKNQIDSVLGQTYPSIRLLVRDDGSDDGTRDFLATYKDDKRVQCEFGENLGVVQSFYNAAQIAAAGCDYLAFCDQDDVWYPHKIERAVTRLEAYKNRREPIAYCSEYRFCDGELNPVSISRLNDGHLSFQRTLFENKISGNTLVINKMLLNEYLASGCDDVTWHDWWIALIAYSIGSVIFDDYCCLDYRRTGTNVSPTGAGFLSLLKYRYDYFFGSGNLRMISSQLRKLERLYGKRMAPDKLKVLQLFNSGPRIRKAMFPSRLREKCSDELFLRLLFLIGCL